MKRTYYVLAILAAIFFIFASCSPNKIPAAPTSSISDIRARLLAKQVGILSGNENVFKVSATKSMLPFLDANSFVVVEKIIALKDLRVGDIIVYQNNKLNKDVIHKVVYIGEYVTARGDNNSRDDEQEINLSEIKGRVFCIIYGRHNN